MIIQVKTQSGSTYLLNKDATTWERTVNPPADKISAFPLRTQGGPIDEWPEITVGRGLQLYGPPITPGMAGRLVYTSDVVSFEELFPTIIQ